MRYILRKFVEAPDVAAALAMDSHTPVHDAYLKEGEEPKRVDQLSPAIGFMAQLDDAWRRDEVFGARKKN
jgi:hypothetical protein